MIEPLLYSLAGKKQNNTIDEVLQTLIDSKFILNNDKRVLRHCLEVSKAGNYPSSEYFTTFYAPPAFIYKSLAEIVTYSHQVLDFYEKQFLQKEILTAINDTNTSEQLRSRLLSITDTPTETSDNSLTEFKPILYSDAANKPQIRGICTGVSEIDDETNGFQEGCIASIGAFTGHGKSTFVNSIVFKNVLEGKKCVIVSLELAPNILWPSFQSRYLFQVHGVQVSAQDLLFHKVPHDMLESVNSHDDEFRKDVCSNLLIVDESILNKRIVTDARALSSLFKKFEDTLGGLDCIVFDHVGQFELLYPEQGNQILKNIQSVIKTYVTDAGTRPCAIWAVQCNRDGMKRAQKNNGQYSLTAIADLNECERSSSYVIFMYTDDNMKISQETKLTLSKHRLGGVIPEPITTTFNPAFITVGSAIEAVVADDSVINSLGDDFLDFNDDAF